MSTIASSPAATTAVVKPGVTFPRVLRSERTKLWTLRSTRWTLLLSFIGMAALGPLIAAVQMSRWSQLSLHDRATFDAIDSGVGGNHLAQLGIGVLGVLVISGEYSTGMIRSSLMAVPRRLPVLWTKIVVYAAVTFVLMLIAALISFFVVQAIVTQHHVRHSIGDPGAAHRRWQRPVPHRAGRHVRRPGRPGPQQRRRDRRVRRTAVRAAWHQRDPALKRQRLRVALPAAQRRDHDHLSPFR